MDDDQWSQLLRSSSSASSQMKGSMATFAVGRDMFQMVWEGIVKSMCSVSHGLQLHNPDG